MGQLLDSLRTSEEPIVSLSHIACVEQLFQIAPPKFDVLKVAGCQTLITCAPTSLGICQHILQRHSEDIAEVLIPQFVGALVDAMSNRAAAIQILA
jgi:hypothetical protein